MTPYGIPLARLIELTGVHPDTARRWKREQYIPRPWDLIVQLRMQAPLGELAQPWDGWHLRKDLIISPEGWSFTPGQVRAIPLRDQLIRELQRERATPRQLSLLDL